MTSKTNAKPGEPGRGGPTLIVFGLSEDSKPRAGTFQKDEIEIATKASVAMGLSVLKISDAKAQDLAAKIPAGRVHANGRGFVPFIRGALYTELTDLAKAQGIKTNESVQNGELNSEVRAATANGKSKSQLHLPKTWEDIDVGHLVITQDTDPKDGWWPAIVVQKKGEMFTLRWQQSQSRSRVVKHKYNLGLIWPGDDVERKISKPKIPNSIYPENWQAISLNHLVLAQEDGPMQQFWEANPIKVDGDSFTLRWRDYPSIPTIVRRRVSLALLHPSPDGASAKTTVAA